jgi:hypothetical protein
MGEVFPFSLGHLESRPVTGLSTIPVPDEESPVRYPSWKRTLAIMVAVQFSSAIGFSVIFPFLPLYVKLLGSTTGLSIEVVSGLVFSVQALTMAIASPFWGSWRIIGSVAS